MANFKLIYQILTLLDKYLDHDDPDWSKLSAEHFKVTEKWFMHIGCERSDEGSYRKCQMIRLFGKKDTMAVKFGGRMFLELLANSFLVLTRKESITCFVIMTS